MMKKFAFLLLFLLPLVSCVNRQGADVGEKYRTGIYSEDPSHLREAEAYIRARPDRERIRVEEHQDHLDKFPDDYCHIPRELMRKYLPKE